MKNKDRKVFVAMSGGVDSSVAALLLQKKGYDITGCFIKGWYPEGFVCNWKEDRRDATRVCAKLGIPFLTIDAEKEYKRDVIDYMMKEYKAIRTPNPDVMCNRNIKFGVFLKKALKMGADYIATGHYVRLRRKIINSKLQIPKFELLQAIDKNKDQLYFLWTLTQKQLKYCLFPIGDYKKLQVRAMAKKSGLSTAEKKDSQGLCFVGKISFADFLRKIIPKKEGEIRLLPDNKIVGRHDGAQFYTIGQRHGLKIAGKFPYYVVAKDPKKNIIFVATQKNESDFYQKEVITDNVNWINGKVPDLNKIYLARIRYRQPLQKCRLKVSGFKLQVIFEKPQRAVTSGQSLVLYDGPVILGGGIIA